MSFLYAITIPGKKIQFTAQIGLIVGVALDKCNLPKQRLLYSFLFKRVS
jgi:hypothetical protein